MPSGIIDVPSLGSGIRPQFVEDVEPASLGSRAPSAQKIPLWTRYGRWRVFARSGEAGLRAVRVLLLLGFGAADRRSVWGGWHCDVGLVIFVSEERVEVAMVAQTQSSNHRHVHGGDVPLSPLFKRVPARGTTD